MEGVKLATEQRWQDVLIESDAELVIKHINGASFLWKLDTIVENIKVLATPIESISWAHIPRAANQCANWLAKHAMQGMCTSDCAKFDSLSTWNSVEFHFLFWFD